VGGWAGTSEAEEGGRTIDRVRNMILVVGAVKIFAVPAARRMLLVRRVVALPEELETYVGK
jgi:hypothetical protein